MWFQISDVETAGTRLPWPWPWPLPALTEVVKGLLSLSGQVLAGLLVFGVGLYLANLAAGLLRSSGSQQGALLAQISREALDIVNLAFGLLLGASAGKAPCWRKESPQFCTGCTELGRPSNHPHPRRSVRAPDHRGRGRRRRGGTTPPPC